ncbi:glutamine synthetase III family protein [Pelobacter propionicus]|uniref:L-glutamine synthetase n=1 Tax=Pelobacter propionicus (strain DSM 2379 / NBRC 103807 / OttBd1) TaxID=338966 RepID=A1APM6_PELPD|nr:glutamine synthetase III [Pelobacter propionicus]ABK99296.1 L-glutamine synthetase [Pelobacter propionicus DSM 2379]
MEIFGQNVFNQDVMRERLPKAVYKNLKKTIDEGLPLDPSIADVVATAMKEWAVERGATHFTHWFQPMTGVTAEKQDSFITPTDNGIVMDFSGKELVKGEPDASSFPSGGLRATFEARGYTAWDCTSPAFLKEEADAITLCIPTAFCSYTGEALDKKTPLLRSMEALSTQALRILRLFGNQTATRVTSTVGPEQEYFLVDKSYFLDRLDLVMAGRTLFGAMPPKGQEMEDHYFGSIKERVVSYMKEVNTELWKLGVTAKTQHNEVAPGQFEVAPIFETTNIATDHNQLVMDVLKRVAIRHDMICLMHEKPFAGVNGSGKHNNWSMSSSDGQNLLDPGKTPHENAQFLTFLMATIKAVDEYAGLLRSSCASAGNDHRLGANEAPPAIISMFLGEQLAEILEQIEKGATKSSKSGSEIKIGVTTLPALPKDTTDRNRTSPFAFTGNRFEFRMLGSTFSISGPNIVINTIIAEALKQFADTLEGSKDFTADLEKLLQETAKKHKRVVFNGNNYSDEWVEEAKKRGLLNIPNTPEALKELVTKEAVDLFVAHKVFTEKELHSRYEIMVEQYVKTLNIEALTMIDMAKHSIMPAATSFATEVAQSISAVAAVSSKIDVSAQTELLEELSNNLSSMNKNVKALEKVLEDALNITDIDTQAAAFRENVFAKMLELRADGDALEKIISADYWPLPTYAEMLFNL